MINGRLGHVKDCDELISALVLVHHISMGNSEEMLVRQYIQAFVERHCKISSER